MDPAKFNWLDSLIGGVIGAVSGAFTAVLAMIGWFNRKIEAVEEELNKEIDTLKTASTACLLAQTKQAQMHVDNQRRLENIEDVSAQILQALLDQRRK